MKLIDKYVILAFIGRGSFGEVWLAESRNRRQYALKIETTDKSTSSPSTIEKEYRIYMQLIKNGASRAIPRMIEYIETPVYHALILEMLDRSLDDIISEQPDHRFDSIVTTSLGIQMTQLIYAIHAAKFVHRDIKPNNFMIAYDGSLKIIDFGLSKCYINSKGRHIPRTDGRSIVGTSRYVSINVHDGIEPSRRDDVESVGYLLVYFLYGHLPWQGLGKDHASKTDHDRAIADVKRTDVLDTFCDDTRLLKYIAYSRSLLYTETPDYNKLVRILLDEEA